MCRKQPLRNGLVFEALMRSRKRDGDDMESMATSASPIWIEGEKLARFGTVNSAERRKPK